MKPSNLDGVNLKEQRVSGWSGWWPLQWNLLALRNTGLDHKSSTSWQYFNQKVIDFKAHQHLLWRNCIVKLGISTRSISNILQQIGLTFEFETSGWIETQKVNHLNRQVRVCWGIPGYCKKQRGRAGNIWSCQHCRQERPTESKGLRWNLQTFRAHLWNIKSFLLLFYLWNIESLLEPLPC